jgi:hypothetical protein
VKPAVLIACLLAGLLLAAQPDQPRVTRPAMAALEASFDRRVIKPDQQDPFMLLGNTRGLYLEGYGAVFSTEVSLVVPPRISPFQPDITKDDVQKVNQRKLKKLPMLRQAMRQMLAESAARLDGLRPNEQIVLGVSLFYYVWEDRTGLPSQILMQASKSGLAGKSTDEALATVIRQQEF